jgi:hypothetical protein
MLTYDTPALWQTGSRNLAGQKTLPMIVASVIIKIVLNLKILFTEINRIFPDRISIFFPDRISIYIHLLISVNQNMILLIFLTSIL